MANTIHVLLSDHENPDLIVNMLQYLTFEVSIVSLASTAVSVLSSDKKVEYDLVIANLHSPDSYAFQLLHLAVRMDIIVILMSNIDDPPTTTRALEQGAFLCIEKHLVTVQVLEYLWQHVSREKLRRIREREPEQAAGQNENPEAAEEGNGEGRPRRRANSGGEGVSFRRKVWTEWTVELHTKFMAAAKQLGPGRCYPKDILELMNVPGLTRMQVASHLQKCRNAKWLPPEQRKYKQSKTDPKTREYKHQMRAKTVKFGSMPFVDEPNHQQFALEYPPPQAATFDVGSSSTGYQIPNDGIIPFAAEGSGTFDGGLGYSADEVPFAYGQDQIAAPVADFGAPNQDAFELQMMVQNFAGFQQGGMGYDGGWMAEN